MLSHGEKLFRKINLSDVTIHRESSQILVKRGSAEESCFQSFVMLQKKTDLIFYRVTDGKGGGDLFSAAESAQSVIIDAEEITSPKTCGGRESHRGVDHHSSGQISIHFPSVFVQVANTPMAERQPVPPLLFRLDSAKKHKRRAQSALRIETVDLLIRVCSKANCQAIQYVNGIKTNSGY